MIGSYQGSSGAERALREVVEAMVMPEGIEARLRWPAFGNADRAGPLIAYQRRDTQYETGQTKRLLEVDGIVFDIFIWSANENAVLAIMDALENGFNTFPLRNGLQAMRVYLTNLDATGGGAPPTRAGEILSELEVLIDTGSVIEQEENLGNVNQLLAELTTVAGSAADRSWSTILAELVTLQGRLRMVPPYTIWPLNCRDLTAPEVYQLGLSGRIFSVVVDYTAA